MKVNGVTGEVDMDAARMSQVCAALEEQEHVVDDLLVHFKALEERLSSVCLPAPTVQEEKKIREAELVALARRIDSTTEILNRIRSSASSILSRLEL